MARSDERACAGAPHRAPDYGAIAVVVDAHESENSPEDAGHTGRLVAASPGTGVVLTGASPKQKALLPNTEGLTGQKLIFMPHSGQTGSGSARM
jgi:hypothetical protein